MVWCTLSDKGEVGTRSRAASSAFARQPAWAWAMRRGSTRDTGIGVDIPQHTHTMGYKVLGCAARKRPDDIHTSRYHPGPRVRCECRIARSVRIASSCKCPPTRPGFVKTGLAFGGTRWEGRYGGTTVLPSANSFPNSSPGCCAGLFTDGQHGWDSAVRTCPLLLARVASVSPARESTGSRS